jgi:hypothetical protein
MAKFHGAVGFSSVTETADGVMEDVITEKTYFGDVLRNSSAQREAGRVNDDVRLQHSISIVSDDYANSHVFAMRYVLWSGIRWTVISVEVQSPRLLLTLGGVYNGPAYVPPSSP